MRGPTPSTNTPSVAEYGPAGSYQGVVHSYHGRPRTEHMGEADGTTFDLGTETVAGDPRWTADFADPDAFRVESESPAAETVDFGGDELTIDCTENADGVTVWLPRAFPADVLVEFTASCNEAGDRDEITSGRNMNLFLAGTGEDGDPETLASTELSGDYNEYHELPNYIFTWTMFHTRMRRDPGFELHSEFTVGAQPNHSYDVQVLKLDDRLAATIDGRLVHDWTDEEPHGAGWVGLRTWNTDVRVERWAVYEPTIADQ